MIDFMLFRGFDLSQTNGRMDICTSRVAFATENGAPEAFLGLIFLVSEAPETKLKMF